MDNCGITTRLIDGAPYKIYHCADLGGHFVNLTVTDANTNSSSCLAFVSVVSGLVTSLTYSGDTSGVVGTKPGVTLKATLTAPGGLPFSGYTITFTIGSQRTSAFTNPKGMASANLVL